MDSAEAGAKQGAGRADGEASEASVVVGAATVEVAGLVEFWAVAAEPEGRSVEVANAAAEEPPGAKAATQSDRARPRAFRPTYLGTARSETLQSPDRGRKGK